VAVAIAISYLDRQALPVAVQAIAHDIPLSNEQFSELQSAFLIAYALMYAGGGKLMDVLGTRRGFTVIMVFWSLACASHALAGSVSTLAVSRLLLGAGEGGGFPAATRAVAEWFPVRERSTAMGIINAGTAVGMVVAPPLIALVIGLASWRAVFFVTGALGLAWTLWWHSAYFAPDRHPRLGDAERQELQSVMAAGASAERGLPWLELLRFRQTWGVVIAKFLSDAAWYFYLFWLPKYLYDARGFDIKGVATFAWIPPLAAGIGCLVGGSLSSYCCGGSSRSTAPARSRSARAPS
jgi:ACS family hexuronate transporter-like MFS transporter